MQTIRWRDEREISQQTSSLRLTESKTALFTTRVLDKLTMDIKQIFHYKNDIWNNNFIVELSYSSLIAIYFVVIIKTAIDLLPHMIPLVYILFYVRVL